MHKHVWSTAFAAVAAVAGLWLGEHQAGPLPVRDVVVLLLLAAAGTWPLWRVRRLSAFFAALAISIVFIVPWLAGAQEATYAFNDCVQNGEQVREALSAYRLKRGRFPDSLTSLNVHLPGQLLLPPHTLSYRRTSDGYLLVFSDWLVTHEASEAHSFIATK